MRAFTGPMSKVSVLTIQMLCFSLVSEHMDYQGYFTREEVLALVEKAFPFTERPTNDEIFAFDKDDLMRKILEPRINDYNSSEVPYEGVLCLDGESGSITSKAVQWIFPSLLRITLKKRDLSGMFQWGIASYLDYPGTVTPGSSFDFSWLNNEQARVLHCVLEYLAEEHGIAVSQAQENLGAFIK